jgi:uncharacterized protein (TIGR02145 family)
MKKAISLHFMLLFFSAASIAQSVGIGTTTPNRSAQLDVQSNNKGFLPPRMTQTQRNALASPAAGLMIYCSDCGANGTGEMNYYNGQTWVTMNIEQTGGAIATSLPRTTVSSQVWSTKNLDVITYRNGDPIPQVRDSVQWRNLTTGAWCWYKNDSATYAAKYGRLYNGFAVLDPRGLAPQGWHIPTRNEWEQLIKTLDPSADTSLAVMSQTVGTLMKNSTGWTNPECATCSNGNNQTGFSALPGGLRQATSSFSFEGLLGVWWTNTQTTGDATRLDLIYLQGADSFIRKTNITQAGGLSVRLVRDQPAPGPYQPTLGPTTMFQIDTSLAFADNVILSDGGSIINTKGVCWSISPNPTTALSTKTNDGSGVSSYASNITGLSPCTSYFLRPYATNGVGTAYGPEVTFKTKERPTVYSQAMVNTLSGDYTNTNENLGGSPYGPYTTKIVSITPITSTSANIVVQNIFDYGWAPITFELDWTDSNNRFVWLDTQRNIALGSTLVGSGSPYSNWQVQVGAFAPSSGTFSICDQTLQLRMRLSLVDPSTGTVVPLNGEYIVNMAR